MELLSLEIETLYQIIVDEMVIITMAPHKTETKAKEAATFQ